MTRINLQEAANLWTLRQDKQGAPDLVAGMYPELIQKHDPETGRTLLYLVDYGAREVEDEVLLSDVCVIERTGAMTIVPREVAFTEGVPGFGPVRW